MANNSRDDLEGVLGVIFVILIISIAVGMGTFALLESKKPSTTHEETQQTQQTQQRQNILEEQTQQAQDLVLAKYKTIEIEDHEYIAMIFDGSISLCHKANCKYCLEKGNPDRN